MKLTGVQLCLSGASKFVQAMGGEVDTERVASPVAHRVACLVGNINCANICGLSSCRSLSLGNVTVINTIRRCYGAK
ncbi:MAG: hypothetical protein AAF614_38130 [Chloroflexota bacterium]